MCWFCKVNRADESSAYEQKMYGDVAREWVPGYLAANQVRTTWRTVSARVPRCVSCREGHARRRHRARYRGIAVGLLFLAIGIGLCIGGEAGFGSLVIIAAVVGLAVVAAKHGRELPARELRGLRGFEPIRQLLAEGWAWGERPPTAP